MTAAAVPTKSQKVQGNKEAVLLQRLARFRKLSLEGEEGRRSQDRRGAKLSRGNMWDLGITRGRQPITANISVALVDRLNATITRNKPMPQVDAINSSDDDSAMLLQGALETNWRYTKMQEKLKQGQTQCTYTRPLGWYSYWDTDARGGLGDMETRLIPGWRLIIDNRYLHIRDMEYCGFREEATRAKLIGLFPDKVDELEAAGNLAMATDLPGLPNDPLKWTEGGGDEVLDRNVVNQPQAYLGKTSVNTHRTNSSRDPLSDRLEVEYIWYKDPTPLEVFRPKRTQFGHAKREFVRHPETNEIQFDIDGYDVVDGPFGPMQQPRLKPQTKPVYERTVVRKYKYTRHLAWIPHDRIILWDVAWNGPTPIGIQRDNIPITGFWTKGKALRLAELGLARNVLYTIIFERLKLSLGGAWMANKSAGLKANKLTPESGQVYQVNNIDGVKPFPVQPLDSSYFSLLDKMEAEMMALLGLSPVQQGQAAGRADSPSTYDTLLEAAGVPIVDSAQLLENTIEDWATINAWLAQENYTHEHYVELEEANGDSTWRRASALEMRGDFAVRIETGSMVSYSENAQFARAQQYAGLGFYALPMLGKVGHVPFYKKALKQKLAIAQDPKLAALFLGAGGATPSQASTTIRQQGRRNHHAPNGK